MIIISFIIIVKANRNPGEIPDFFGYKPMIVLSGSMETSIYTGDLVLVKEVPPSTLKENDIIAFRNEANTVTTHRIIEIITNSNGKEEFRTKGDNNTVEDLNLVQEQDIEGVYVFKIPKIGNIVKYTQNTTFFIIVICIIYIIYIIISRKEDIESARHEKRKEFEKRKK